MCEKKELSICWIKKLYKPSDILLRAPFQSFIETLQKKKNRTSLNKRIVFFFFFFIKSIKSYISKKTKKDLRLAKVKQKKTFAYLNVAILRTPNKGKKERRLLISHLTNVTIIYN